MVSSLLLLATRAQAQSVPRQFVDLQYDIDPALQSCPSTAEFRSMVAQQLGYDPYRAGSPLGVDVRVRPTETGIEGVIGWNTTTEKGVGERHFASRSEDCREMMTTVGFVVAVQIQLMATEMAPATTPQSSSPESNNRHDSQANRVPADASRTVNATVTLIANDFKVRPGKTTDWTAIVGAGPAIGFGLGPVPIFQGRLFTALQLGRAELEVGAEASLPSTTHESYGSGFRHELLLGTLAACGWYRSSSACGLAKLGLIRVHGTGLDKSASPEGLLAQGGLRLAHSLGLSDHLFLLGRVEALYSLTPWTVDLNHLAVWTMPRFSVVTGIDLAVRFR